ncbi:MAG: glycosyltransferase [Opitutae bacterium]|nr:glycosyltransferase [Opitutae bacterium]
MRIYLAFFQTQARGPGTANYGFWADLLRAGLTESGHTVLESNQVDWASGLALREAHAQRAWLDRAWSVTLAELAQHQAAGGVDLFLGYFFPKQIEPAAVREIARRGIPTVNFFCDNVREYRRVPEEFRAFDLQWVPEWAALPLYAAAGLKHLHAPMPMWVEPEFRRLPAREENSATFLGSHDSLRSELFSALAAHGARLRVHGKGWVPASDPAPAPLPPSGPWRRVVNQAAFWREHGTRALFHKWGRTRVRPLARPPADWLGGPVERAEYTRLSRESAVTVGVNRFESPQTKAGRFGTYSRLRDLEATMLGACYLTEWAPGLDQLYDLDREIAVYRDAAGLAAQLSALLADPARRAALRAAAQRRALAEHTVGRTMDRIAVALGLNPSAKTS